jgi:hypothetical protein
MFMSVNVSVGLAKVGMIGSFSALGDGLISSAQSNVSILSNISSFFLFLFSSISLFHALAIASSASTSHITNAARKFAIAFQIPSGNGPDRVSFHSHSICRSLASQCTTVLSDMVAVAVLESVVLFVLFA